LNNLPASSHWYLLALAGFTCAVAMTPLVAQELPISPGIDASDEIAVTDTDQDGITDDQEIILGSDANNPDTDGDGLLDGEEVTVFRTDPTNVDTDGDTLQDGAEVDEHNTSPTNPDTDGDLLQDRILTAQTPTE